MKLKLFAILMLTTIFMRTVIVEATPHANGLYTIDIAISGLHSHKAIELTPEILNHAGTSAIRIVERESGDEIPFFVHSAEVEAGAQTIYVPFNFIREFTRDGYYYLDFEVIIPANTDPLVSHLQLEAWQEEFLKDITVLGSYDGQNWTEITNGLVYAVSDVSHNEIALGGIYRYHFYRLRVPTPQEYIDFRAQGSLERYWAERVPFASSADAIFEVESLNGLTTVTIMGLVGTEATMQNLRVTGVHIETDSIFKRRFRAGNRNFTLYRLPFLNMVLSNTFVPYLGHPQTSSFYFTIADYDDRPIDISRITVEYTTYYLVFRAEEGKEYALIFGGRLERPRYDIENFRDWIIIEGYDRVYFSGAARLIETVVAETGDYRWLFNIAMITAGILLTGIVVADFLRRKKTRA